VIGFIVISQESQHHDYKTLLGKMYLVKIFILSLESPGNLQSTSWPWQLQVSVKEGTQAP